MMNKNLTTIFALLLAGGLIVGGYYYGTQAKGNQEEETADGSVEGEVETLPENLVPSPLPTGAVEINTEGQPYLGKQNASVEVVEFLDFQCPYCKKFAEAIVSEMKKEYIDTGKVKLVTKDFPLQGHIHAWPASYAANCAFELGGNDAYFKYHDVLFDQQDDWGNKVDPKTLFIRYAKDLGLDETKFETCYENKNSDADIQGDVLEGQQFGVNGTPIFFVNGDVYVGVPPTYEDMRQVLQKYL